jgi:hypothetical protein
MVWSKALSKTTPVSGSFTVQVLQPGSTRMRVSMSADGYRQLVRLSNTVKLKIIL